jgi:pimeloyl-ACP methyl ester carboxylesterase
MVAQATPIRVPTAGVTLAGDLAVPPGPLGVVLFAHGSGSSRHSPRNRAVAGALNRLHLATVLVDLFTPEEEARDARTRELRFDIGLLADRLAGAVDRLGDPPTQVGLPVGLPVGLFGASTGAAAALVAAAARPGPVRAVVSRGGRPDLAGPALARVRAPTLLLVGGNDPVVRELNNQARRAMGAIVELRVVAGAGHLFAEPGTLERVADEAGGWFVAHLPARPSPAGIRGPGPG